jgi:hypothetical protein
VGENCDPWYAAKRRVVGGVVRKVENVWIPGVGVAIDRAVSISGMARRRVKEESSRASRRRPSRGARRPTIHFARLRQRILQVWDTTTRR